MSDLERKRTELLERLDKLKLRFDVAIRYLEQEEFEHSANTSQSIMQELSAILNEVSGDYRQALHELKLPDFEADRAKFQNQPAIVAQAKDRSMDFLALMLHLEQAIRVTDKEIRTVYHYEAPWMRFVRLNWRKITLGVGVAALVLIISISAYKKATVRYGLVGNYYADTKLRSFYKRRVDKKIAFDWLQRSPFRGWRKDKFSVRWTGFIKVPRDGVYEFFTHSDDGVRLVIGGQPIITNWSVHRLTVDRGSVPLKKGVYPIKIEYFEQSRKAIMKLSWKSDSDARATTVPSRNLIVGKRFLHADEPILSLTGESSPETETNPTDDEKSAD
jgi:hypothetical protein